MSAVKDMLQGFVAAAQKTHEAQEFIKRAEEAARQKEAEELRAREIEAFHDLVRTHIEPIVILLEGLPKHPESHAKFWVQRKPSTEKTSALYRLYYLDEDAMQNTQLKGISTHDNSPIIEIDFSSASSALVTRFDKRVNGAHHQQIANWDSAKEMFANWVGSVAPERLQELAAAADGQF